MHVHIHITYTELKDFQPSPLRFDLPQPLRKAFARNITIVIFAFALTMAAWAALSVWVLSLLPLVGRVVVPSVLVLWFVVSYVYVQLPPVGGATTPTNGSAGEVGGKKHK